MQQRYYSGVVGRFLSVDPITTDANSGGSFNRYKYANNNPFRYVDPDGRSDAEQITIVGKLASGTSFGWGLGSAPTRDSLRAQYSQVGSVLFGGLGAIGAAGCTLTTGVCVVLGGAMVGGGIAFGGAFGSSAVDLAFWLRDFISISANGASSPDITPDELRGKSKDELEQQAKDKGLVQDAKKPNKWRDPVTGDERMRIDPGHVDPKTGQPYGNPRAASPHVHGYDQAGNKIRDPLAGNDPHFPIRP